MAHPRARAAQASASLNRLIGLSDDLAKAFGVDAPVIPTYDRDPTLLPVLQLEAMSDFLAALAETKPAIAGAKKAAAKKPAAKKPAKPKAPKPTTTPAPEDTTTTAVPVVEGESGGADAG